MFDHVTRTRGQASLAFLALLGLVAGGCSAGAPVSATPSITASIATSASPTSSPEAAASVATPKATPPPSAGPGASASQPPIPDGVYVTGDITQPLAFAALKAAHVPLDAATKAVTDRFGYPGRWKMQLDQGHLTRWCSGVGGAWELCDKTDYAFPDAHTMVVQDIGGPCVAKLTVRWQGSKLYLNVLTAPCNREFLVVDTVAFGSTPWTREP